MLLSSTDMSFCSTVMSFSCMDMSLSSTNMLDMSLTGTVSPSTGLMDLSQKYSATTTPATGSGRLWPGIHRPSEDLEKP